MSASNVSSSNSGNLFFDLVPNDPPIFDCLRGEDNIYPRRDADERSIGRTARVCKAWRDNPQLVSEREAARRNFVLRSNFQNCHRELSIVHPYPRYLIQLFRSRAPIHQLEELDLGVIRRRDYFDIRPEDMNQPVMRFRDASGRPGLALKIRANCISLAPFTIWIPALKKDPHLESYETVMAIFERSYHSWFTSWGDGNDLGIRMLYDYRHANDHRGPTWSECRDCPFQGIGNTMKNTFLKALLEGTDPDFSLPGHAPKARGEAAERKEDDVDDGGPG